jgi:hypothetical protein
MGQALFDLWLTDFHGRSFLGRQDEGSLALPIQVITKNMVSVGLIHNDQLLHFIICNALEISP